MMWAIPTKKQQQPQRETTSRVRFEEAQNRVREFEVPEDIPYEDLWFTGDEYQDIKSESRTEAREWRKKGFSSLLKETFEMPSPDTQKYIQVFCALEGHLNQRGLERHCSRKHGGERSDCKDRARQSVFETQFRLRAEGLKADEVADSISASYINGCREAKIFALRIAKADQAVALEKTVLVDTALMDSILGGCRNPKMPRRMSNMSNAVSVDSFDSRRPSPGPRRTPPKPRCPGSPASPAQELYAAIA